MGEETKDRLKGQAKQNPYAYGYARMPRVIRLGYKEISQDAKLLYIYLRDICGEIADEHGENAGVCYMSFDTLVEETGFSKAFLSKWIPKLHNAGLIHAEKQEGWGTYRITITDIWEQNANFLEKRKKNRSPNEQSERKIVHQKNKSVHLMNEISENCSSNEQNRSPEKQSCSPSELTNNKRESRESLREEEREETPAQTSQPVPSLSLSSVENEKRSHAAPTPPVQPPSQPPSQQEHFTSAAENRLGSNGLAVLKCNPMDIEEHFNGRFGCPPTTPAEAKAQSQAALELAKLTDLMTVIAVDTEACTHNPYWKRNAPRLTAPVFLANWRELYGKYQDSLKHGHEDERGKTEKPVSKPDAGGSSSPVVLRKNFTGAGQAFKQAQQQHQAARTGGN